MGKLEKQILETSIQRPLSWFRFIDDVDMKWVDTEEDLENFVVHANSIHPSSNSRMKRPNPALPFLTHVPPCQKELS